MKFIIGILLIVFSFNVNAKLIPMPVCQINGVGVTYQKLTIPKNIVFVASAVFEDDGTRIIRFNNDLLSQAPEEWQRQALLHECGHFKNHFDKTKQRYKGEQKEYAADCYSAEVLKRRYNYGPKEFDIIIGTMLTVHLSWNRALNFERCALTK